MTLMQSQQSISSSDVRPVKVTASGHRAVVEIEGHDVSRQLAAYTISQRASEVPEVVVWLAAHAAGGTVFDGMARVVVGEPPDPGPAAAAFLDAIDAGQLEKASLARHDLMDGGPHELIRVMLAQLKEWALGQWHDANEPSTHEE
ncbi:hypothetical protein Sipo8835_23080 [Streptomyces ipomoeae]|uniref:Uncharacterized protein n=1 Tax=Streptomyces ipomoeae TaxID=103232 RepID=A0AAE8W1Y0_9ACTN|nr:hypothetical protein [Streptomyces ipomoeae]TQE30879.1 hypothetical protein Sipo8835_23080 [Streptomyces ipomoeae]